MSHIYQMIGMRIRRARETLKMSQAELAAKLGFQSSSTISYYELGERKISIVDLQKIAQVLGLPVNHFLQDETNVADAQYLRFRAQQVQPAARDAVVRFLAFARANGNAVSPLIRAYANLKPKEASSRVLAQASIREAPVLPEVVADHLGVPVYTWAFPDEISGLVVCSNNKVCIGVNELHAQSRQRFSAAHELGHLLLEGGHDLFLDFAEVEAVPWYHIDEDVKHQEQEKRANWFAADLLMPAAWLEKDYRQHEADLPALARKYGVSQQALWFRLLSLKLIQEQAQEGCL